MKRPAFTLFEVVAALAIFGFVAIVIGRASFNALYSVSRLTKDSVSDAYREFMRTQILAITSLEDLRAGLDIDDANGDPVRIVGEAEPTQIMDLFILRVHSDDNEYRDVFYLNRPTWYDQMPTFVERADMLRDRNDYLEEKRRTDFRERETSK